MGNKRSDVIRTPPSPLQAVTLADIRSAGWSVLAACPACRIILHADIPNMIQLLGPDFVLWGRHPRCRVWIRNHDEQRCKGRIVFQARSIQSGTWVPMEMTSAVASAIETRAQFMASARNGRTPVRSPE